METHLIYKNDTDVIDFCAAVRKFCFFLKQEECQIEPYNDESVRHFALLEKQRKYEIMQKFHNYSDLMYSATRKGISLRDDQKLLKNSSEKLGISYSDDLYSSITSGDIIEIYNMDLIQVYRNLALFDICGYTLMDLLSYEFYELYERSDKVNHLLLEVAGQVLNRPYSTAPISLEHIPRHLMREKFSITRTSSYIDFKVLYPVYAWPQKTYGVLTIQTAQGVNEAIDGVSFI